MMGRSHIGMVMETHAEHCTVLVLNNIGTEFIIFLTLPPRTKRVSCCLIAGPDIQADKPIIYPNPFPYSTRYGQFPRSSQDYQYPVELASLDIDSLDWSFAGNCQYPQEGNGNRDPRGHQEETRGLIELDRTANAGLEFAA